MIQNRKLKNEIVGVLEHHFVNYTLQYKDRGAHFHIEERDSWSINILSGRIDEAINDLHLRGIEVEYNIDKRWIWTLT